MNTKRITKMALVAAVYVALTYIFAPISYGEIQFRISELLVLLAFYKKDYIVSLVIGTLVANLMSSLGPIDLVFGTLGTLFGVLGVYYISKIKSKFSKPWIALFIASLFPVISNALLVGWELSIILEGVSFQIAAMWVAIGEFTVVSIFAVIIFSQLERNQRFIDYLVND